MLTMTILALVMFATSQCAAAEMEWLHVSEDGEGFVLTKSNQPFVPWGFNYDHDADGQLLEEYWDDDWATVESDFRPDRSLLLYRNR